MGENVGVGEVVVEGDEDGDELKEGVNVVESDELEVTEKHVVWNKVSILVLDVG